MRKSVYRFFKLHFTTYIILQVIVFLLSLIGCLYFREGTSDDFATPVFGFVDISLLGVLMLESANRLTYVNFFEDTIVSFSLVKKKCCCVDLLTPYFYARVRVANRNAKNGLTLCMSQTKNLNVR